jgi:hypothetical protein
MQPIHFLAAGCSELPHRDGSSNGVQSRQNRDGTKQLYGLWPTRVPTSRRRCLLFPSKGIGKRRVPETSPCHGQAKQSGELDPRKVTMDCRERSRGIETSTELVVGSRNASAQFVNSSARGQPRLDPVKENLRSPTRRPIKSDEVEPSPQGSRAGSRSQILTPAPCVRSCASVRQTARRAGPRLVQLVLYMFFLYKLFIVSYLFV